MERATGTAAGQDFILELLAAVTDDATSLVLIVVADTVRQRLATVNERSERAAKYAALLSGRLLHVEAGLAGRGVTFRDDMWTRSVDGRLIGLLPQVHGGGRIGRGRTDDLSFDDVWDYLAYRVAIERYVEWDGRGEPSGWVRHMPTARRRPDGDATREYVRV